MAHHPNPITPRAADHAARPFIILRDENYGRFDSLDEAVSVARRGLKDQPTQTFIVARIVATVEPSLVTSVAKHRL